ncbi:DUF6710 family protein [Clostridium perfringens]|uniref:Uncharacterized protein n=1 Tax=Clostridium perfringens E str. JGS1987 TaxID=451755 RepID=B1BVN0_CLOPF|nr:DUF6710 family protein [Clostridium perfringens]EDT14291.1 conserved hypothetical protein [Clostridium perfringens E str. JGS1987]
MFEKLINKFYKTEVKEVSEEEIKKEEIQQAKRHIYNNSLEGFYNCISFAKEIISKEKRKDSILLLDYMMNTIKNDLKYSLSSDILYKKEHEVIEFRGEFLPNSVQDEKGEIINCCKRENKTINTKKDIIISIPWNRKRKISGIKYLSRKPFEYKFTNHAGQYYTNIDLTYITGGIHSISSGDELCKECIFEVEYIVEVNNLYNHLYTDGFYWYNKHTRKVIESKVSGKLQVLDVRIAILFELSRLKYNLENKYGVDSWDIMQLNQEEK